MSDRLWITNKELAERWRLATNTPEQWRCRRIGPAWTKIGGRVRYLLADIEAFEKANGKGRK
jgi:hypothetical protein